MERSVLSRFADLRSRIEQLNLSSSIQRDMEDILEEMEKRLYAVEQDNNLLQGHIKGMKEQLASLNHRYSELLYALSDRRRG